MKKALYWLRPCCCCCGWFRVKCVKVFFAWGAIFISCLFSWRGSEWLTAMIQYSNTGSNREPRLNFREKKGKKYNGPLVNPHRCVILRTFAKQILTSVSFFVPCCDECLSWNAEELGFFFLDVALECLLEAKGLGWRGQTKQLLFRLGVLILLALSIAPQPGNVV